MPANWEDLGGRDKGGTSLVCAVMPPPGKQEIIMPLIKAGYSAHSTDKNTMSEQAVLRCLSNIHEIMDESYVGRFYKGGQHLMFSKCQP